MTAFEEVLKAEQEAEQTINTAKEQAATALAAATEEQQKRIADAKDSLKQKEVQAVENKQKAVTVLTDKIKSESESAVAAFKQRFSGKEAELRSLIKQSYS